LVVCPLDPSPLPLNYRVDGDVAIYSGDYQRRARRPSSDVDVCFGGRISATLIQIEHPAEPIEEAGLAFDVSELA